MADRGGQHTSPRPLTGHCPALSDLARVPRKSGGKSAKNGKGCKERRIAATAGEDKLRPGFQRVLKRLDTHHADDARAALDSVFA